MNFEVLGKLVEAQTDDPAVAFEPAKELAKARARALSPGAMLLSWYCSLTGEHQPTVRCGKDDRPPWIVWAASRGADLTVSVNRGAYIFYFLL